MHRGGVAQVFNAQVGRKMFGCGKRRRGRDDAVDIVRAETGVGNRVHRRLQHEAELFFIGAAGVGGLSNTGDTRLIFE